MMWIDDSSDQTRQKSSAVIRINKGKVLSCSPALYAIQSHLVLSESKSHMLKTGLDINMSVARRVRCRCMESYSWPWRWIA